MTQRSAATLGVDIGTSSVKVVAYSDEGAALAQSSQDYTLYYPGEGIAEQDPAELISAVWAAIRSTLAKMDAGHAIRAVGFSSVMHSILAVDTRGTPLTPMMTWADSRSFAEVEELRTALGSALYHRTGTPLHPMLPAAKIAWIRRHMPDLYSAATRFVSIKELVTWHLTQVWVVDHSTAAASGMFDIHTLTWDALTLQFLDLPTDKLSQPVPTTHCLAVHPSDLLNSLGLDGSVQVVVGSTDGLLATIGTDAIRPGDVALTIGSSGAIRTIRTTPWTDPQARTFCYPLTPDHFVIGGAINSGGLVLRWLRDQLAWPNVAGDAKLTDKQLLEIAEQVTPGAEGLLFLPYLAGERAPHWDDQARGAVFGLGLNHTSHHIARAAVESIVYSLYSVYRVLEQTQTVDGRILLSGGLTRSTFLQQLVCDVFGKAVEVTDNTEASCFGAFVLAQVALGRWPDIEAASQCLRTSHTRQPDPARTVLYHAYQDAFEQLYQRVQHMYPLLNELNRFTADDRGVRR